MRTATVAVMFACLAGCLQAMTNVTLPEACQSLESSTSANTAFVVATGTQSYYAVSLSTGAVAFTFPACDPSGCSVNHCLTVGIADDLGLAFYSGGGGLYAYSKTGLAWSNSSYSCAYGPTYHSQSVYVTTADGNLLSLDASTGAQNWYQSSGNFAGRAVVAFSTVFIVDTQRGLCALHESSGKQLWCKPNIQPQVVGSTPSMVPTTFIGSYIYARVPFGNNRALLKVNGKNGNVHWNVTNLEDTVSSNTVHLKSDIVNHDFEVYTYNGTAVVKVDDNGNVDVIVPASENAYSDGLLIAGSGSYLYNLVNGEIQSINVITGSTKTVPIGSYSVVDATNYNGYDAAILTSEPAVIVPSQTSDIKKSTAPKK
jgi:outer membrane protein assembly factor BamB